VNAGPSRNHCLGLRVLTLLDRQPRGLAERSIARTLQIPVNVLRPTLEDLGRQGKIVRQGPVWRMARPSGSGSEGTHGDHRAVEPPRGVELLRRLCAFYADLTWELATSKITLEERGDPRTEMEAPADIDWFLLAKGQLEIPRSRLPFAPPPAPGRVTFCGPLHFLETNRRARGRVWMPVFLVHARCHRRQHAVAFEADTSVQVNLEWLDTLFPLSDEAAREDFLIRVGLLVEERDGRLRARRESNLRRCVAALREVFPPEDWVDRRAGRRLGLHDRFLVLPEDLSPYLKGLVEDLREMAEAPEQELARSALPIIAGFPVPASDLSADGSAVVACHQPLNPEQHRAIEQAMEAPLTVVQGPPGTGKSTLVRSLLLSQGISGRTALFASRNHRALAAVIDAIRSVAEEKPVVIADVRATAWLDLLERNLHAPFPPSSAEESSGPEAAPRIDDGRGPKGFLDWLRRDLVELETEPLVTTLSALYECRDRLAAIEQELRQLEEEEPNLGSLGDRVRAEMDPGRLPALVDWAERSAWNPLSWASRIRLRALLQRLNPHLPAHRAAVATLRLLARREQLLRQRSDLEGELKRASSPTDLANAWFNRIERQVATVHDALPWLPGIWAKRIRGREQLLAGLRRELGRRRGGRRSPRSALDLERRDFAALLPGLPLWSVTNLSVRRRVPFVAGAFDLVIVDEAAQCDPASVLPLLFRARRAIFVGDPKQLPPVGGLGATREEELRRRHGLEGPEFSRFASAGRSAWDLAYDALLEESGQAILLREHYRCDPRIAEFFSREFYDGRLILRTVRATGRPWSAGIRWTHVPGGSTPTRGSRWHEPQVEAIVRELEDLADREFDGSVGVVTPFREHATRIRDRAYQRLGPRRLDRWDFLSQTADGFQGGEKEIVLFGLVGGPNPEDTPPFYQRDLQRFNVAVSRAKLLLHVFGDRNWARACEVLLLRDLLIAAEQNESQPETEIRTDLIGPVWEPRLAAEMRAAGLEFRQQYPACGFYLDFALFRSDGARLDVEVDGETYHRGPDGGPLAEDVRRDLILRANGWTVRRFWVYEIREDMSGCLQWITEWTRAAA